MLIIMKLMMNNPALMSRRPVSMSTETTRQRNDHMSNKSPSRPPNNTADSPHCTSQDHEPARRHQDENGGSTGTNGAVRRSAGNRRHRHNRNRQFRHEFVRELVRR